jgi:adenosylcobinamide kinase/adenosylcobinamide-phosphate guanylyltransferase
MIFITGGARSGKSGFAEKLADESGRRVTYIATAAPGDGEMRSRIAAHRQRRPAGWNTVEAVSGLAGAVEEALADGERMVLIDCLTVYLSNLMLQQGLPSDRAQQTVDKETDRLVEVCQSGNGRVIMVSNEVGMGIVPGNALARAFRDAAGRANQKLAAAAEEVYICVSGIPLKVK